MNFLKWLKQKYDKNNISYPKTSVILILIILLLIYMLSKCDNVENQLWDNIKETFILTAISSVIATIIGFTFVNRSKKRTFTLDDFVKTINPLNTEILKLLFNDGKDVCFDLLIKSMEENDNSHSPSFTKIVENYKRDKKSELDKYDKYELFVKICFDECSTRELVKVNDNRNVSNINRDMRSLLTDFKLAILLGYCLHRKIEKTSKGFNHEYIACYEFGMVILGYVVSYLQNKPLIISTLRDNTYIDNKGINFISNINESKNIGKETKIIILNDSIFGGKDLSKNIKNLSSIVGANHIKTYLLGATSEQQKEKSIIACYTLPPNEKISTPYSQYAVRPARIAITNRCNLNCNYHRSCHKEGLESLEKTCVKQALGREDINNLIRTLEEYYGRNSNKKITLTGGEPLLVSNLSELITCLTEASFVIGLTTNGRMLTKNKIDYLIEAGLKNINISIYSHKSDLYNEFHRPLESYNSDGFRNIEMSVGLNGTSSILSLVTDKLQVKLNIIFNREDFEEVNVDRLNEKVTYFTELCAKNKFTASFICDVSYSRVDRERYRSRIINIIEYISKQNNLKYKDDRDKDIICYYIDNIDRPIWEFNNYDSYDYLSNEDCNNCPIYRLCDHQYALRFSIDNAKEVSVSPCLNPSKIKQIKI